MPAARFAETGCGSVEMPAAFTVKVQASLLPVTSKWPVSVPPLRAWVPSLRLPVSSGSGVRGGRQERARHSAVRRGAVGQLIHFELGGRGRDGLEHLPRDGDGRRRAHEDAEARVLPAERPCRAVGVDAYLVHAASEFDASSITTHDGAPPVAVEDCTVSVSATAAWGPPFCSARSGQTAQAPDVRYAVKSVLSVADVRASACATALEITPGPAALKTAVTSVWRRTLSPVSVQPCTSDAPSASKHTFYTPCTDSDASTENSWSGPASPSSAGRTCAAATS